MTSNPTILFFQHLARQRKIRRMEQQAGPSDCTPYRPFEDLSELTPISDPNVKGKQLESDFQDTPEFQDNPASIAFPPQQPSQPDYPMHDSPSPPPPSDN